MIGLALAAGKTVSGDRLLTGIRSKKVLLVVAYDTIGANSRKKLTDKCETYEVPLFFLPAAEMDAVSRRPRIAYGVTDAGFAKRIEEILRKDR